MLEENFRYCSLSEQQVTMNNFLPESITLLCVIRGQSLAADLLRRF